MTIVAILAGLLACTPSSDRSAPPEAATLDTADEQAFTHEHADAEQASQSPRASGPAAIPTPSER